MMLQKRNFLLNEYPKLLKQLDPETKPLWGLMNPHQMVEHMCNAFQLANGKIKVDQQFTPEEHIPRLQSWLLTDKPMKENIQNPLVPQIPPTPNHPVYEDSIHELQKEMMDLFAMFDHQEGITVLNPFYGKLNCELYTNLLYKHALHHLRQFGIEAGIH